MSTRIPKLTWSRIVAAACLGLLAAFVGCGDKETAPPHQEESPFLPRTSPTNVLYNLKTAYAERNIAEYESLLAEPDFTFVLSEEDQAKPDMPDNWGRDPEIRIHGRLFDAEMVQQLTLNFNVGDPVWDATQGMYTVVISHVNLYLYGATPGHPTEVKEYRVSDGRSKFWFRKNPWTTGAAHDSVWTIVMWEDNPTGSRGNMGPALSEVQTWGSIKALYD
jgi:hypothetical protein